MENNYCTDSTKIENYEKAKADNFVGWCIHHRLETKCPVFKPSVKDWGLYYNRPPEDPVYRQKLSDSWSNRDNTERCKKISDKMKGNHNVSGLKWYNNGSINKRAKECQEGFVAGRI